MPARDPNDDPHAERSPVLAIVVASLVAVLLGVAVWLAEVPHREDDAPIYLIEDDAKAR